MLAPIIRAFEVKAFGKDKAPVIEVTDLFKKDVPEFSARSALNAGAMDDADGDGMPNWAEYRAGTDPTNRFSLLMFDSVAPEANSTWIVMRWQSAGGKSYRLERGTNLTDQAPFSTLLRTNITATAPMNVETDKTAVGEGPWFYRIELE